MTSSRFTAAAAGGKREGMRYNSPEEFIRAAPRSSKPVAICLCEDDFFAHATVMQLFSIGFENVIAAGPGAEAADPNDDKRIAAFPARIAASGARTALLNQLLQTLTGRWTLICFNGEFPFFPFSESRSVVDFADFLRAERRSACAACAIDLYSDNLVAGEAPDLDDVYFDAEGWYGFDRGDRLVDIYGGLGWRFEEFSPVAMSRVNRPAFFHAAEGAKIRDDLWLEDAEANTISCPWHNNPTMAIMSFRRARRLLSHPNFRNAINTLMWPNSRKFEWRSDQLASLGMIEAGQWI